MLTMSLTAQNENTVFSKLEKWFLLALIIASYFAFCAQLVVLEDKLECRHTRSSVGGRRDLCRVRSCRRAAIWCSDQQGRCCQAVGVQLT